MARRTPAFQTVRSEGGLLPPDLLARIAGSRGTLAGTRPADFGLPPGDRPAEAITRSWNTLRRRWADFREAARLLPPDHTGTSLTNDKWTLPLLRELGFGFLPVRQGPAIDGQTYAISRFSGPAPIHLVGCGLSLDRRATGERGAAKSSPHGLLQEFLNRSDAHLWGLLSNGLQLRILRDSRALSRQSFLEFDLEAMFDGEVYSDFALLYLVAHATRFLPPDQGPPESCMLEGWTQEAQRQGTRALTDLRQGVEHALLALGEGLSGHPANHDLRAALAGGSLPLADFHGQLLRAVYRFIFLFVAEDRFLDGAPLLHPPGESPDDLAARARYAEHYSTARLRRLALSVKGSRHGDLWTQFQIVVRALSGEPEGEDARRLLALPALGSFLWSPASTAALGDASLSNYDLLRVIRHLAFTRQDNTLRAVDYRNLGAEELGGVYESLLALTPRLEGGGHGFTFAEFAGNERKTSGSYYTPDSLVRELLDSALDPVVEARLREARSLAASLAKHPASASTTAPPWAVPLLAAETAPAYAPGPAALEEQAILSLKVCDPAAGSGHFLVGAAHRLARHLARVRAAAAGDSEPSPLLYQQALRDVIGRCLYGVDLNPMAAELCRVSLWLEALEPGKPLSFLDHRIRVGNSLIGTTPGLIAAGIPDDAYRPIEGDDKRICTELRKENKAQRNSTGMFNNLAEREAVATGNLADAAAGLALLPDDRPELVRAKEEAFRACETRPDFIRSKWLADAWCSAFVIEKRDPIRQAQELTDDRPPAGITFQNLLDIAEGTPLHPRLDQQISTLAARYRFFHWHLAFPEVFAAGGFDCILGNPPWERVKLQEKEWFAERSPAIAAARNAAARKRLIEDLKRSDPILHGQFLEDVRRAEGESHFLRNSGRFPLCGRGDINVYTVFAEAMRDLSGEDGRTGCILPTGIATDDTTKHFFQNLVSTGSLASLFDFENKGEFFPGVHSSYKFSLVTLASRRDSSAPPAEFVFFAHRVEELADPDRRFTLSSREIALLNPNTRTCPVFRSRSDAELTKAIYRRVPILIREAQDGEPEQNPWGVKFTTLFHMSNDSGLFRTRDDLEAEGWTLDGNIFRKDGASFLPLYEAKMIHHFDHRWATYDGLSTRSFSPSEKRNPRAFALPRYFVDESHVAARLSSTSWSRRWLLGWRDICRSTDERTVISAVIPYAPINHKVPIALLSDDTHAPLLAANFSSLACDFVARQKIGGTSLTYFYLKQIPFLPPDVYGTPCAPMGAPTLRDWLLPRIVELTYTAWDMEPFARDCGFEGPPFRWDDERRFLLRCEIDALFFHLYLPSAPDGSWLPVSSLPTAPHPESPADFSLLASLFPTPRHAISHILDSFPIIKRHDLKNHDSFRTKSTILSLFDALHAALHHHSPYSSPLSPPPASPSLRHPPLQA